jgi:hydroxymethylpyrimidine/phosphomethylpyrimidine kinase
MKGRVLIIAGSDSGGGAGIQADIKTVSALGGYAATAITALTAQNTLGVHGVVPVAPDFIVQQMQVVLQDIGADAIKTGMLYDEHVVDVVCDVLESDAQGIPVIVDTVMVAKGGASLLSDKAAARLHDRLMPLATLITPNIPEAEALTGLSIKDEADMKVAGEALLHQGAQAVLLKGGHGEGEELVDLLFDGKTLHRFTSQRIDTSHAHGTGCTLSSAIATYVAQGYPLVDAVELARDYVHEAIQKAPGFGQGHGPLNHMHVLPSKDA